MSQVITFSFFRFPDFKARFWGFKMMQLAPSSLSKVAGLQFFKVMGTGGGDGFQWHPDFSTYCIMGVWDNLASAEAFYTDSTLYQSYASRSGEKITFWLNAVQAQGFWSGMQPFESRQEEAHLPFAVLTRATIRWNRLGEFWRQVPKVSQSLQDYPGKLFRKGIGEWPLIQQATFSIWRDKAAMIEYAYRNPDHKKVIAFTRKRDWYSEEMFVRMQPFRCDGTWEGKNPLSSVIPDESKQSDLRSVPPPLPHL